MDELIIARVNSTGPISAEIIIQEISQLGLPVGELNPERLMGNPMIILTMWQNVHDFHATILHLLGIDHERLTFKYQGRHFRLTDVHGHTVKSILS